VPEQPIRGGAIFDYISEMGLSLRCALLATSAVAVAACGSASATTKTVSSTFTAAAPSYRTPAKTRPSSGVASTPEQNSARATTQKSSAADTFPIGGQPIIGPSYCRRFSSAAVGLQSGAVYQPETSYYQSAGPRLISAIKAGNETFGKKFGRFANGNYACRYARSPTGLGITVTVIQFKVPISLQDLSLPTVGNVKSLPGVGAWALLVGASPQGSSLSAAEFGVDHYVVSVDSLVSVTSTALARAAKQIELAVR
jgi:hypothetical protein